MSSNQDEKDMVNLLFSQVVYLQLVPLISSASQRSPTPSAIKYTHISVLTSKEVS